MNKHQYRAIVQAQRRQRQPCGKLIHLLINYRSHNYCRYPKGFYDVMRRINTNSRYLNLGIHLFFQFEGDNWRQPNFETSKCRVVYRETEPDLPF